jgi:tetratricopeptide (TPR) repeat protein
MSMTVATVVDYYTLFEIDRGADAAAIQAALKASRKRWRQLTGSPDKERARLAEQHMEHLEAAENVLLEESARAVYDAQLAAQAAVPVAPTTASTDWGVRAESYYFGGDVNNAYLAAKKGTDTDPENNLAWRVYVWAAVDLKRYEDADFASAELVQRVPQDATSHELRGGVLDAMGRFGDAEASFRRAVSLAPSKVYYQGRAAWAVLDQGRTDDAIREAWTLVERFPDDTYPVKVLRAASEALREKKRPREALDLAAAVLGRYPQDEDAILLVALAIQDIDAAGDVGTALAEAWRLYDAYPQDDKAQRVIRYVIGSLRERGMADAALAESRKLLARQPQDQDVRTTFAWSRIGDAEARLSSAGPDSHIILNKAQATYYAEAIREIEGLDVHDPAVRRVTGNMGDYAKAQSKMTVRLSLGKVILGILAVVLLLIGLGTIASGGFVWLLIGGLLGWAFYNATFKRQYQLNYKSADAKMRTKGLR